MSAQPAMSPIDVFDVSNVSSGMSVGGNVAMLIPGRQPMFAVSAVASDFPTLMSQLMLAGASVQNSVMTGAVCTGQSVLPANQRALPMNTSSTFAQPQGTSVNNAAFSSQTPDCDERDAC